MRCGLRELKGRKKYDKEVCDVDLDMDVYVASTSVKIVLDWTTSASRQTNQLNIS